LHGFQGFGTLLIEGVELIARDEHGSIKLAVIGLVSYIVNGWKERA
jgi:histone acetyltransferase (RNA polymerase elongator complex component)